MLCIILTFIIKVAQLKLCTGGFLTTYKLYYREDKESKSNFSEHFSFKRFDVCNLYNLPQRYIPFIYII